jgi:membrane-associated protein
MSAWVIAWIQKFSYPAVYLLLLGAGLGLPISEDLVVISGGAVMAKGGMLWLMMITAWAGKLSGDFILFRIGWRLGPRAHHAKHFKKILTPERVARVDRFFQRFGVLAVFFARFLPGLRAPTYLIAGISRFSAWKFVVADGVAASISAPLLTWLGYRYGLDVLHTIEHHARWALVVVGAIAIAALLVWLLSRKTKQVEA